MKGVNMRAKLLCCLMYVFIMLSSGFTQYVWEWRNPLPQRYSLYEVAYGDNQFIAVDNYGIILASPDGVTWTERYSGTTKFLNSVTYGKNHLILVCNNGTIISSKAKAITGNIINNLDSKVTLPLSIKKNSNRLFIQMSNTRHVGKDLRISLFNTTGRTIYVYTTKMKIKIMARKLNFPISGFSGGINHAKITIGKDFEYYGSIAITR